jgi:hypothetical protein
MLDGLTVKEGETEISIEAPPRNGVPEPAAPPADPAAPAVCDPFGEGGSLGRDHGLKAELFHLEDDQPQYEFVADYIKHGHKAPATLYLNQVNVPTRRFDQGFATTNGQLLKTLKGDTLYEWFSLRLETVVRLGPEDSPGRRQFALLADDGAMLYLHDGSERKTLVSNDGWHGTRFRVAPEPVTMDQQSALSLELQYFQGPRYHIALILMWRDWPEEHDAWRDPLDGRTGNELYFDSTKQPSAPQQAYLDLLSRGWRPLKPINFFLPEQEPANPCPPAPEVPEEPELPDDPEDPKEPPPPAGELKILSFDASTTESSADAIWQTPGHQSTGTLRWGSSPDALVNEVSTSAPGEVHLVTVHGLDGATRYYFQVEARAADGTTVHSQVISKFTK